MRSGFQMAQGVVTPIYNFTFDPDAFVASIGGNVLIDIATSVNREGDGWKVGPRRAAKRCVVRTLYGGHRGSFGGVRSQTWDQ